MCNPQTRLPSINLKTISDSLQLPTIRIMDSIKVEIRKFYILDEEMTFEVDSSLIGYGAVLHYKINQIGTTNDGVAYDLKMSIGTKLDSIFLNFKKCDTIEQIVAISAIAHELVHRYQLPYFELSAKERKLKRESEAYAVGGFYFLQYYNPNLIKSIFSIFKDWNDRRIYLKEAFFQYVY